MNIVEYSHTDSFWTRHQRSCHNG